MDYNAALKVLTAGIEDFQSTSSPSEKKQTKLCRKRKLSDGDAPSEKKSEKVAKRRIKRSQRIKVKCDSATTEAPPAIISFTELTGEQYGVSPALLDNLGAVEYAEPTQIQSQAIPILLKRRNLLASAPTGSGKTAAFFLPLLHHVVSSRSGEDPPRALLRCLILAPTQELARQIHEEGLRLGRGLGVAMRCLSKRDSAPSSKGEKLAGTEILISTPLRLQGLLAKESVKLDNLSWLIVDECDKLFESSTRGFHEQLTAIYTAATSSSSGDLRCAFFSATVQPDIRAWVEREMGAEGSRSGGLVEVYVGVKDAAVSSVAQELRYCGSEQGKLYEIRRLLVQGLSYPCLIFLQSRDRAKELFKVILTSDQDLLVNVISGGLKDSRREATVRAFREGKLHVLICTDLLCRGIDFKGVRTVINYDLPPTKPEYIHRIGRTGRAGQGGRAITLWTDADIPLMRAVIDVMEKSGSSGLDPELVRVVRQRVKRARTPMTEKGTLWRSWNPKRKSISECLPVTARAQRTKKTPHT